MAFGEDTDLFAQFRQFMTQAGDGTGSINFNGDYSASAVDVFIQPPANRIFLVGTVFVAVSGSNNMTQDDYGDIAGGVTNGVMGFITQAGTEVDAFQGHRFKQNVDWYGVGSETVVSNFFGIKQTLTIRFNTYADTGGYVRLDGRRGDKLGLRLNDNFSTLIRQIAVVRGLSQIV